MDIRYASHPEDMKHFDTTQLRKRFLIEKLFTDNKLQMTYSHHDRMIIGGAKPVEESILLEAKDQLRTEFFLERREIGLINIGGPAKIEADEDSYELARLDALYLGKGVRKVVLSSKDHTNPAKLYFCSALAHAKHPNAKVAMTDATPNEMGSKEACNERTIYQYIHDGGIKSCQLMMGVTMLKPGSIWNTMPAHHHDRRMEVYLYFDLAEDQRVFHFMGEPHETRHIVMKNEQAVISPSWSIHSGAGTSNYAFIWSMAGENYTFKDMDVVEMKDLQ